jgi:hypothetical protein
LQTNPDGAILGCITQRDLCKVLGQHPLNFLERFIWWGNLSVARYQIGPAGSTRFVLALDDPERLVSLFESLVEILLPLSIPAAKALIRKLQALVDTSAQNATPDALTP